MPSAANLLCILIALPFVRAVPRPEHTEHAKLARWLVHESSWGTLSTQGGGHHPSAGVVSFSDGPLQGPAAGRIFFYLTSMDETGRHVEEHPNCALSISEAQLHPNGCGSTDPMDPTCARIAVLGRMLPVESAADKDLAQQLLFKQHPAMKTWPADHGFLFFELHLNEIHMLDWYGGMHIVTPEEYLAADLHQQQRHKHQQPQQQQQQHRQQPSVLAKKLLSFMPPVKSD